MSPSVSIRAFVLLAIEGVVLSSLWLLLVAERGEPHVRPFYQLSPDSIREILMRKEEEAFTLVNGTPDSLNADANLKAAESTRWSMRDGGTLRPDALNELLQSLRDLTFSSHTRLVLPEAADQSSFGLERPTLVMSIKLLSGEQTIRVGQRSEYLDQYYSRIGGYEALYLIPTATVRMWLRPKQEWLSAGDAHGDAVLGEELL